MGIIDLDNRDIAVLLWTALFVVWALSRADLRPAISGVLRSLAHPLIAGPIIGLAAYTALLAWLGSLLGVWQTDMVKETVLWFFGVGLGLLLNLSRVLDRDDWLQTEARRALRATIVVEFFVNLAVLPLPLELILVPFLTILILLSYVGGTRKDFDQAKGCVDGVLTLFGVALLVYVAVRVATDFQDFGSISTLQHFAVPIWLTLATLPFIYLLGLWSGYQKALAFVSLGSKDRATLRRARWALLLEIGPRARELGRFYMYPGRELAEAGSLPEARAAVAAFRAGLAAERQAVLDEEARLERYAGVEGVDEEGRRLDQREFAETKEALQYIGSCQMGWYNNPEQEYRAGLLGMLEPFSGLPEDHGITLEVAEDGQSWWAFRQTVTGWCFAIGADGPPPNERFFDGPEPPSGFPGDDPAWGELFDLGPNWL